MLLEAESAQCVGAKDPQETNLRLQQIDVVPFFAHFVEQVVVPVVKHRGG